jgi:hypothetical protein
MKAMRRAPVAVLALLLFACGGGDDDATTPTTGGTSGDAITTTALPQHQDADDAYKEQFEFEKAGQWARLYARLHPAQQALVTEAQFVSCADKQGYSVPTDTTLKINETYPEETDIPGTDQRVPSTAVTFTLEVGDEKQSDTIHLVDVDGVWRWILNDPAVCTAST